MGVGVGVEDPGWESIPILNGLTVLKPTCLALPVFCNNKFQVEYKMIPKKQVVLLKQLETKDCEINVWKKLRQNLGATLSSSLQQNSPAKWLHHTVVTGSCYCC